MGFVDALRAAMISNNLPYYGRINLEIGRYHTFNSEGICKKKCCRYRIFENYLGAQLRCWRRDINIYWFFKDYLTFTPEQKNKFNKERADQLDLKEKERKEAINLAKEEWWLSSPIDPNHPYILKKQIIPYRAQQLENSILLPIYNSFGEIISNQKIYPDGSKRFSRGAPIKGGFLILGEEVTKNVLFCEGWATGCTLHECTHQSIIIAFSSSNLPDVAPFIRKKLPEQHFIYCADKDKNGIGEKYAIKAANTTGGIVIVPHFYEKNESFTDFTDFNDVLISQGMDEVTNQLNFYIKD